ncbi:cupin domain-containing protein [Dyella subtropica]|uniref:cupin domain-containing protein n=1 Tax=Dyella subtropica TaxID=2992127 RepID=UPI0022548D76|nr:cupin domain-containing protein [Dyella subtropica]
MTKMPVMLLMGLLPLALHAASPGSVDKTGMPVPKMATAPGSQVMLEEGELQWAPSPMGGSKGSQWTVLLGDPDKPGVVVIRVKNPAGYKLPMHWHSMEEQVTVLEGDLTLRTEKGTRTLGPGGFFSMPAKMPHETSTVHGVTVQINEVGPTDIHFVNPADDPGK